MWLNLYGCQAVLKNAFLAYLARSKITESSLKLAYTA
jgi:hypothetical protein